MSVRVAVVGFGYVGVCVGAVLAGKKYDVVGIDTRDSIVESINRGVAPISEPGLGDLVRQSVADGHLRATTEIAAVRDAEVVLVTVGTPLGDGSPDTEQVSEACRQLAPHLQRGQLVILKSTVPPFTTETVVLPILESEGLRVGDDFFLAFCPERLAEGRALSELQVLPVVVGGVDEESTARASAFWVESLGLETIRVANARTAELSKLADNWWIDLNIAMGNELALLSAQLDVDVLEVISAANSLPKGKHHVNILLPSVGVGGSCLTKDPWFVDHLAREHGLDLNLPGTGRQINDSMPMRSVSMIREEFADDGRELSETTVAVLGLAFKDNTGDVRHSPAADFVRTLEDSGASVRVHDPLVSDHDLRSLTAIEHSKSIEEAVKGADCVAFLTGHDDFKRVSIGDLAQLLPTNALIFDGRMYFSREQIAEIEASGLRYRGIGR